ncbi:AAA family ATPase [Phytohabitans rumicis]|uniref:DNA helicase DnaB-like N-terminal domain-containing protein n=1 Tax=Phytohabitans rumicis TaxID=1076125 RepID=A0A6V8L7P6_9ACTN|nr:AAA family ATPase [Phytohabitans rumicis]GFJ91570.1 hypothetical protein Prum_052120 [Phytohabitans rumicis]
MTDTHSADDEARDAAERVVLGAMLLSEAAIERATELLRVADFYRPRHAALFNRLLIQWAAQKPTDAQSIIVALSEADELGRLGGGAFLHDLIAPLPSVYSVDYHARTIIEHAGRRRFAEGLAKLDAAHRLTDTAVRAERVTAALGELVELGTPKTTVSEPDRGSELDAFLGQDDEDRYEWLIPGLIERGDRLILTGREGGGKSTLLRQIALQAASGVHPFGAATYAPLRVLVVDLENSERQLRRELRPVRLAAGTAYGGALVIKVRTDGLNLLDARDVDWFLSLVATHQPDMLITGPAYKMAAGNPIDEEPARIVAGYLDRIRVQHDCAIALEAHTPQGGYGKRPERPYGASLWLRWPEFGLFLSPEGHLRHWRGKRDASRDWPAALQRGGEWPWMPVTNTRDVVWARMVEEASKIDGQISNRALAKVIEVSEGTIRIVIKDHEAEWAAITSGLLGDDP